MEADQIEPGEAFYYRKKKVIVIRVDPLVDRVLVRFEDQGVMRWVPASDLVSLLVE